MYEIADLFNKDIMDHVFVFFGHPVDFKLDDMHAGVTVPPDLMTQQFINKTSGDLNLRHFALTTN